MTTDSDRPSSASGERAWFATTRWTRVIAAGGATSDVRRKAIADLCQDYWYPIYAFVRRQGLSEADAQDATQGFFVSVLEREVFAKADPDCGRFRSFLLVALKRFLANARRHDQTQKRGGNQSIVSIDAERGEDRLASEPAVQATPEAEFDRRWALTLLENALGQLQQEMEDRDQAARFIAFRQFLVIDEESLPYAQLAEQLDLSLSAVKVAAHRFRKRYREVLREQVAHTVGDPDLIGQELSELLAALRR